MAPTKFDVLILGSGTSSQLPVISCLIAKPPKKGCQCCLSTLAADGSGRKNARRNTSAIVQFQPNHHLADSDQAPAQRPATVLIDVGKSFCEAAREHFPKHGLDTIDAVFLTHPHADAINGLDDLRAWTLDAVIQATIPIYCNQSTFDEVAKIFPYMVNPGGGTGGGDVPAFQWHIIESDVPFELLGVQVSPLKVHHGCYFNACGQPSSPYECLAFLFDQTFCYMSDVSSIPESTWAALGCPSTPSTPRLTRSLSNLTEESFGSDNLSLSSASSMSDCSHSSASSVSEADGPPAGLPLLIVDTMRLTHHISHFGIADAVETAAKLRAHRTYILGFTHGVTHECWQAACELISETSNTGFQATLDPSPPFPEDIELGNDPPRFSQQALALCQDHIKEAPLWIRPAFDGLVISTDGVKTTDNFHP
ncbi:hypothetical protein PTTG_03970 [Puccinia triticina 1-1 BBBD Race 1]|uniref:Lactamase_B domain-containing protein n=1 Tax=Puccinia triticina (isolate 1-1 / race 1 (BBBD)) TaxID=630390 RepID=A0A180H2B5_PUCT1|nr:hypothetical protein PTTG_03970 [Puccinia triticina 1-1 BBBD Race 1]